MAATFQERVGHWMQECFSLAVVTDVVERNDRFIEEALELVQANGYSAERAHALVDYVFNRPVGEPDQETGGVLVTLAALCNVAGVDIGAAGERELARINHPVAIEKIRKKQASKPTGSALPIPGADEKHRFLNRLKILRSIDKHEIDAAIAPYRMTDILWTQFRDDPYRFTISAGELVADAIWSVVARREAR